MPGVLAALRITCDVDAPLLPPRPGEDTDLSYAGTPGARAHVIRALVLELEGLGPYGVLVIGAEGESTAADALLDQTVSGLEIGR